MQTSVQQNKQILHIEMQLNRIIHPVQGLIDLDRAIDIVRMHFAHLKMALPADICAHVRLEANSIKRRYKVKVKQIQLH